jgi:hypothetical protein
MLPSIDMTPPIMMHTVGNRISGALNAQSYEEASSTWFTHVNSMSTLSNVPCLTESRVIPINKQRPFWSPLLLLFTQDIPPAMYVWIGNILHYFSRQRTDTHQAIQTTVIIQDLRPQDVGDGIITTDVCNCILSTKIAEWGHFTCCWVNAIQNVITGSCVGQFFRWYLHFTDDQYVTCCVNPNKHALRKRRHMVERECNLRDLLSRVDVDANEHCVGR